MKVHFDEKADALYVRLDDSTIAGSEEVQPNVILDFSDDNRVVGIEILHVREHVALESLKRMQFEVA